MGKTGVHWADRNWNWLKAACDMVSEGCRGCYSARYARMNGLSFKDFGLKPNWRKIVDEPLHRRIPTRYFHNDMSDIFNERFESNEDLWRARDLSFQVMEQCPQHIFFNLTKRPHLMLQYMVRRYHDKQIPEQIWVGTSIELSKYLSRGELLKQIDAKYRFYSIEPLKGHMSDINLSGISWVIVGGESSIIKPGVWDYKPTPMLGEWVSSILSQCKEQDVSFFFKQWGGTEKCACHDAWGCRIFPMRSGVTWDEFPVEWPPKPAVGPTLEMFS